LDAPDLGAYKQVLSEALGALAQVARMTGYCVMEPAKGARVARFFAGPIVIKSS
jgi:hypothetical protein